ncbi:hypothetical protein WDL1P1_00695 (plasmid) [Variovorax sp. WDL1]|nr:hypothetical protein WDL1P1_00695 [Variovorax sp. WDL1]
MFARLRIVVWDEEMTLGLPIAACEHIAEITAQDFSWPIAERDEARTRQAACKGHTASTLGPKTHQAKVDH